MIPRRGFRTLAALADVADAGVPVVMIAGNHDCWGGDILRQDVGVDYRFGPWLGDIAGWHTRIEHGDGLRPREDRRYRLLRRVLRNSLAIRSFRWLHPDLATRLATNSSHASRTYAARDGGRGLRDAAVRERAARSVARADRVRTFARGDARASAGRRRLRQPRLVARCADVSQSHRRTTIALRRWDGSAESADLHAFHRSAEKALP